MPITTPPHNRWPGSTVWTFPSSTSPRRSSSNSVVTSFPRPNEAPPNCRAPRLWGHPGLRPLSATNLTPGSPLLAYRWEFTDRALAGQLANEAEGHGGTVEPGHAAVRFVNPATGSDVLPTIRAEMHRVTRGAETAAVRETGSSVYQVFDGSGTVTVGDTTWSVTRGDLFVVPSWEPFSVRSEAGSTDSDSGALDLFRFSDAPVFEALHLDRREGGHA